MLRRKIWILAALVLLALPVGAQEATPKPLPGVDDLVAKYLAAIGGRDKLKAVQSVRMSGKMVMGQGMEAPFTVEMKRPKAVRMDFTFQGMTASSAFDGEKGWRVMPFQGSTAPEPLSADEIKQVKDQADIEGPLVDYKEKGSTVELVGKESVEGADAFNLKITDKDGDVRNVYLHAEEYLPIKETMKRTIQGNEIELETSIGEYKDVGGLKFAHAIETKAKGMPTGQAMVIEKIELNVPVDPSRFQMPEAPKPEAAKPEDKKPDAAKPPEEKK